MRIPAHRLLAIVLLVFAAQAFSQSTRDERPLRWHFDVGYSFTTGTTSDYLDDGWTIGGGLSWQPRQNVPITLLAEVNFSSFDATDNLIRLANLQENSVRIDEGDADLWSFNVNGVYKVPFSERVRGYFTAGIGEYHRKVEFSQTVLVSGFFCDPWWGFCYPGAFPGQAIVNETSTWRFAWNAGFGVEFPLDYGAWFIDARYHRMETSEPTEFVPIQVGFRF